MSALLRSATLSVSIAREWRAVYEAIWHPTVFPRWASGLAQSHLQERDGCWIGDGAEGRVAIRFTPHNDLGVMDHHVEAAGAHVYVPMRVVANGDGAEVLLTVFRQPGMSDDVFARDRAWVRRDLKALHALAMR